MPERICSDIACGDPIGPRGARGFCPAHYRAWRKDNGPRCSIESCEKVSSSRLGYCGNHLFRLKKYGDPLEPLRRLPNDGPCSVDGCDQPMRKKTWCASHYAQWYREGAVRPFGYKWADRVPCKVCALPSESNFREFCSGACAFLWRKYDGKVPTTATCVGCGCEIDLTARGKGGQRKKAHVSFCKRCKGEYGKYHLTTAQLAERDGIDCGICHQPVDMDLRRGDVGGLMCASVDHVIPRALGGTHEADNLQLAHLRCNMLKSDRIDNSA